MKAPFPWFGGKSPVAADVWDRLGRPKQYIEPFCGSAAVLLSAPKPASLEVIGDQNCYVANFWRAVKYIPDATWAEADYPISHIDIHARHAWLKDPARTAALRESLSDPEWPGDARIAGWWLWGQCCWIGSRWCEEKSDAGMGVQAIGKIPHVSDAGRGVQAIGKIPHVSDAGRGVQAWIAALSARLERVRVIHGDWSRCLNSHYGGAETAVFLDPPYRSFEALYGQDKTKTPVADEVSEWAKENAELRIALCGHRGDYDMPGWQILEWKRPRLSYAGDGTRDLEAIWFSPSCLDARQQRMF